MKKITLLVLLALSFATSFSQTKFQPQTAGHVYYLDIPFYMTKTYQLNENASMQYQNTYKEAYTIVIDEEKEYMTAFGFNMTADDYFDNFINDFTKEMKVEMKTKERLKINDNSAIRMEFDATVDSSEVVYLYTCVETGKYFYSIISWTTKQNRDLLIDDFQKD